MTKLKINFTSVTGRRKTNEDKHNIILNINGENKEQNPINLFAIYDGHGGSWVSQYLENNIPQYYFNKHCSPPFNEEYHEKVFKLIQSELLKKTSGYSNGSTCLLNLMYKYKNPDTNIESIIMNIVNLGDSRMAIVYTDGTSISVTKDHKPDDSVEKSRLTKMGGNVYKDSEGVYRIGDLSLSRAFGDGDNSPYISQRPDIFYKKITNKTKYIIMACDGFWDVIESENLGGLINKILKKNNTIRLDVELTNLALKLGSTDNISIIVIEVEHCTEL